MKALAIANVDNPHTYPGIAFYSANKIIITNSFLQKSTNNMAFLLKKQNNTRIGVGDNSKTLYAQKP